MCAMCEKVLCSLVKTQIFTKHIKRFYIYYVKPLHREKIIKRLLRIFGSNGMPLFSTLRRHRRQRPGFLGRYVCVPNVFLMCSKVFLTTLRRHRNQRPGCFGRYVCVYVHTCMCTHTHSNTRTNERMPGTKGCRERLLTYMYDDVTLCMMM